VNKSGIGVLLVEQNLHQSLRIAHRGYVLEKGSVVLAGTGKELLADSYVSAPPRPVRSHGRALRQCCHPERSEGPLPVASKVPSAALGMTGPL